METLRVDSEIPTASQIAALRLAGAGLFIPEDLQESVLDLAERGKNTLKSLMLGVNRKFENLASGEFTVRENFLRLAAQIAFSRGIDTPEACQERLNRLRDKLYVSEPLGEGVGFTE